jgi:hypothetical protein
MPERYSNILSCVRNRLASQASYQKKKHLYIAQRKIKIQKKRKQRDVYLAKLVF